MLPALLAGFPVFGSAQLFGIRCDDSRVAVLAAVSGLMVGMRAGGGLLLNGFISEEFVTLGRLMGLSGFALAVLVFPSFSSLLQIFTRDVNPAHVALASVAALQFLLLRSNNSSLSFIFSPGSVSGPTVLEYIFLGVLLSIGFMASPWRQFASVPIAFFAAMSYFANVMVFEAPVRPWPNPVIAVCCVLICLPFDEAFGRSRSDDGFPRKSHF
jgi:hypothetical protein